MVRIYTRVSLFLTNFTLKNNCLVREYRLAGPERMYFQNHGFDSI